MIAGRTTGRRCALALAVASAALTGTLTSVSATGAPAAPRTSYAVVPGDRVVHAKGDRTGTDRRVDPRRTRGLFVDPLMPAAQQGNEFQSIARTPQALWITDYYPTATVRSAVRAYTKRALAEDKTPMLAIYAIPGRDCGLWSSGGLPDGPSYRAWIRQVVAGVRGQKALVVLEPDAVPFMGDDRCVDPEPRQELLRFAARELTEAGAWVYVDAGHSGWRTAAEVAGLLARSGIRHARGFSLNVGNFRRTRTELAYGEAVVRHLRQHGIKGKKYVVETARNGARSGPVDGDVCNPLWARIGRGPKLVFRDRHDGYLWIKHPGESDGECNGGPPSGQWSDLLARRLLGTA